MAFSLADNNKKTKTQWFRTENKTPKNPKTREIFGGTKKVNKTVCIVKERFMEKCVHWISSSNSNHRQTHNDDWGEPNTVIRNRQMCIEIYIIYMDIRDSCSICNSLCDENQLLMRALLCQRLLGLFFAQNSTNEKYSYGPLASLRDIFLHNSQTRRWYVVRQRAMYAMSPFTIGTVCCLCCYTYHTKRVNKRLREDNGEIAIIYIYLLGRTHQRANTARTIELFITPHHCVRAY